MATSKNDLPHNWSILKITTRKCFLRKNWSMFIGQVLSWYVGQVGKTVTLKFIYSEKATKFCKISTLLLSYVMPVKSKVDFVAFSECMNFNSSTAVLPFRISVQILDKMISKRDFLKMIKLCPPCLDSHPVWPKDQFGP